MKILLSGVTRGLGRALAEWYIAHGHTVIGVGRNGSAIFDLRFTYAEPHTFDALDLTEATKVDIWAEKMLGAHGTPDLLLNIAALMNQPAPLWKVPAAELSRLIDVNLKGTANLIRAFVPAMIEARHGVIVNFSSGWGRTTAPQVAPYCASKWGIEGLTQALAQELPAGLAAIALNPGIIQTDMLRLCWPAEAAHYPTPTAWAETAAPYLLSLGAAHNGQSLSIPGC